ncbi:MAG: hypothetical protein ABEJ44_04270 [Halanaeroarchaeum sp.]
MNLHATIDDVTARAAATALGGKKCFAEDLDAPTLLETAEEAETDVRSLSFDPKPAAGPNEDAAAEDGGPRSIDVQTPAGEFRAWFDVWHWRGTHAPTVIYHHGSGEDPFGGALLGRSSAARLFGDDVAMPANVVVVRAPFHDLSKRAYADAMGDLGNLVGMVAASTAVVEDVVAALHDAGSPAIVVSGLSLGGWVTNLHRAVRGSAEAYAPMLAGARFADVFLESSYRHLTAEGPLERPERLRHALGFEKSFEDAESRVSALLARHDRYVRYDVQRRAYAPADVKTIEYGHVTGALATGALRDHVAEAVRTAPAHRE